MTRSPAISIASLGADAQRQVRAKLTAEPTKKAKRPKYGNSCVVVDGYRFHSEKESRRYLELKAMQRAGEIFNLKVQPAWRIEVNGRFIVDYVADFSYGTGHKPHNQIVEDVKSKITARKESYVIKKKLMLAVFGVEIMEV